MVEYLPSIAQVEVAAAGRAAHEMFGFIFWLVAYAARTILATAAQHHAGHIVAWARESSCACFRAMECRSPWRPSRPRISNSTRRRGPGRCEPCEFLMFGTAVSKSFRQCVENSSVPLAVLLLRGRLIEEHRDAKKTIAIATAYPIRTAAIVISKWSGGGAPAPLPSRQ